MNNAAIAKNQKFHLIVVQPNGETNVEVLFDPNRVDIRWSADYIAFRPSLRRWWDERSYIAYQSDWGDYEG
jgi:hypothetical protein